QAAAREINQPMPRERRLELGIGINLGDVIVDGDNSSGMVSTSPPGWRLWPSPARSAFRRLSMITSGTSSISITGPWAVTGSRISRSRSALMPLVMRLRDQGLSDGDHLSLPLLQGARSSSLALLPGHFTSVGALI